MSLIGEQNRSGNEAVAIGALDAGAAFLAAYPGSPVSDLTEAFTRLQGAQARWVANEKVALEVAAGVSYAGARALAVMKHVGLNVAADALYNLAYTGVRGGLVVVVGDDPGARASQNEQDTRAVASAAGVPVIEPADVAEAYVFARLAFAVSEHFDLPVILRLTTQLCYSSGPVVTAERRAPASEHEFAAPASKYLLLPRFVPDRHRAQLSNLARLATADWGRTFYAAEFPPGDDGRRRYPIGVVSGGYPGGALREHLSHRVPLLRVGMCHPLHEEAVLTFAARCERLLVVEECSRFLETRLRALSLPLEECPGLEPVGEANIRAVLTRLGADRTPTPGTLPAQASRPSTAAPPIPVSLQLPVNIPSMEGRLEKAALPDRAPGFCSGCPHVAPFVALSRRLLYVVGDIGCYTMGAKEPFAALHQNLCMGASPAMLHGYLSVMDAESRRRAVAVIGDSTFFHSGMPAVMSAAHSDIPATVLILDNSGSAMTGLQQTSPQLEAEQWDQLLAGLGVQERSVVPAFAMERIEAELDRFLQSNHLSVLVIKGECVQARPQRRPTNYRYEVLTQKCTGCEACLKTDCPSIAWRPNLQGERLIDIAADCIGCGLCAQMCPEQAIVPLSVARTPNWLSSLLSRLPWPDMIATARSWTPLRRLIERMEYECQ